MFLMTLPKYILKPAGSVITKKEVWEKDFLIYLRTAAMATKY